MNVYTDNPDDAYDWRDDALCAQIGGDAWFPEPQESALDAKKICARCPVIDSCLDYSLRTNQQDGIWAGLTTDARRKLRKREAA